MDITVVIRADGFSFGASTRRPDELPVRAVYTQYSPDENGFKELQKAVNRAIVDAGKTIPYYYTEVPHDAYVLPTPPPPARKFELID